MLDTLLKRERDNEALYNVSSIKLALKRMPALLITMALELGGGKVGSGNENVRRQFCRRTKLNFEPNLHIVAIAFP